MRGKPLLWTALGGVCIGALIGAGSLWRETLEGRTPSVDFVSRGLWGAFAGMLSGLALLAARPLRQRGRLGLFLGWILAGLVFFLVMLVGVVHEGENLREIWHLAFLGGIGSGLGMGILELQLRDS